MGEGEIKRKYEWQRRMEKGGSRGESGRGKGRNKEQVGRESKGDKGE